jgi:hypothetical protein
MSTKQSSAEALVVGDEALDMDVKFLFSSLELH